MMSPLVCVVMVLELRDSLARRWLSRSPEKLVGGRTWRGDINAVGEIAWQLQTSATATLLGPPQQ
jgi:hypothetical protein